MNLTSWKESSRHREERIYVLRITEAEMTKVRLDGFDRRLIAACEGDARTISDRLLALELLARRIEESAALEFAFRG